MDTVIALIAATCMFSNPKVQKDVKITCMEKLVNCAVGPDGLITEKQTNTCIKKEIKP